MYACNCGERFAGTLSGAWEARLHAEDLGHRLRPGPGRDGAGRGARDLGRRRPGSGAHREPSGLSEAEMAPPVQSGL
jgi:hypothetical protein